MNVPADTALLVVDVQQALFEKPTPVYRADEMLDNICALIEGARQAGAQVVFIQHGNKGFLLKDSPGWQLHPCLHPAADDIRIYKRHGNVFQNTTLQQELDARGIHTVIITGLVTHGCVKATCFGAVELGYDIVLVSDGHSSFNKNAAKLIDELHTTLDGFAEVRPARDIHFAAPHVPA